MRKGTLEVEVVQGHGLKNVPKFWKSDPYAHLVCGDLQQRTKTIKNGGSDPVWNERFAFDIIDGPSEMLIALYDEEKHGSDEPMGNVMVPLTEIFAGNQVPPTKYDVQLANGKTHGQLELGLKFIPKVEHGILEVHLVEGNDLLNPDVFDNSDPYAVLYCLEEVKKSRVLVDAGINPKWDEKFVFNVSSELEEIVIKLFDKDKFTADDPLGATTIPLHQLFCVGHIPPSKYKVLGNLGEPQGEIVVALNFVAKE